MATEAIAQKTSSSTCDSVNVVASGIGAAEAILGADDFPSITQVITTTPCYVPDYLSEGKEERRLLKDKDSMRELNDSFKEDRKRELKEGESDNRGIGHSWYDDDFDRQYRSHYWDRTERYCNWYPWNCYHYCDWYPRYCSEFCYWFPEFCEPEVPEEVAVICDLIEATSDAGIYSFYGENYSDDVDTLCDTVDYDTCQSLRAAED